MSGRISSRGWGQRFGEGWQAWERVYVVVARTEDWCKCLWAQNTFKNLFTNRRVTTTNGELGRRINVEAKTEGETIYTRKVWQNFYCNPTLIKSLLEFSSAGKGSADFAGPHASSHTVTLLSQDLLGDMLLRMLPAEANRLPSSPAVRIKLLVRVEVLCPWWGESPGAQALTF